MQQDIHWETLIVGHVPVSYCDWPGKLSTVLFTSGCDLFCPTCHNWGIAHPKSLLPGLSLDAISDYIQKKSSWLDGIVISGGEPLIHKDLYLLLDYLKKLHLPIKLDTNGMHPEALISLLDQGYIDTVALDIKAPYDLYPEITGKVESHFSYFRNNIQETINTVQAYPNVNLYFRTTLIPQINNNTALLEEIKSYIPKGYRHRWQAYVPPKRD